MNDTPHRQIRRQLKRANVTSVTRRPRFPALVGFGTIKERGTRHACAPINSGAVREQGVSVSLDKAAIVG
jgi:hypothetical protein